MAGGYELRFTRLIPKIRCNMGDKAGASPCPIVGQM